MCWRSKLLQVIVFVQALSIILLALNINQIKKKLNDIETNQTSDKQINLLITKN